MHKVTTRAGYDRWVTRVWDSSASKRRTIGTFNTPEEATEAYTAALPTTDFKENVTPKVPVLTFPSTSVNGSGLAEQVNFVWCNRRCYGFSMDSVRIRIRP